MSLLDDISAPVLQKVRDEAAAGAKDAVMPWLVFAIGLAALAFWKASHGKI